MPAAVTDDALRDILTSVRTIAVVGASANPARPSYGVIQALVDQGYAVVGVNPGLAVDAVPRVRTYPRLADIPHPVDMVDVFRAVDALDGVLDEVLAMSPRPAVFWTQLGLASAPVAERAERRGLRVVMDRCPAIELPRLGLAVR